MTVNMIPVGSQFVFHGPYDQFADRKGQTATVVAHITEDTAEVEVSEVGPMYTIRFGDGFETEAWPEEVEDLGY
jgi:hypothetical protein